MRLVKANANILLHTGCTPYQFIERVGRICYKSEKNITPDSAVEFVERMKNNKHLAMLEHHHIILSFDRDAYNRLEKEIKHQNNDNYSDVYNYMNFTDIVVTPTYHDCYVSGSFRVFIEMLDAIKDSEVGKCISSHLSQEYPELFDFTVSPEMLEYYDISEISWEDFKDRINNTEVLSESQKHEILSKHIVHTALFICDRGVSHELVRHRPCSFAQESTRFCNYSHAKHGNELTIIKPNFLEGEGREKQFDIWKFGVERAEYAYFAMLKAGCTAQEARDILPTSVKTEIVVTATEREWQHIINLRYYGTTGTPHPQMKEVMDILYPTLCVESDNRLK